SGERSKYKTEVRLLYDNTALYIAAKMYDPSPDSIYKELGERDSDGTLNADNFGIDISPYNDGINGATFKVSVSGVQSDRPPRVSMRGMRGMGGGDTWDAVWESHTTVTDDGWIAEIRIPYSALRFSRDAIQTWGLNFWREVRRDREQSSWNYVDREIGTTFNHLGELSDIRDIEPPLRLSLTPYVSGYLEKYNSDPTSASYNGGLDLKYGINESFTLDATLVPDFGQVKSDEQVLNLTPYEVKFNENRPFFMEGTELFNKGGIFYSRRVGSQPQGYYTADDNLDTHEQVSINPSEAGLINATKLSGRTRGGLGIGVFNAMTKGIFATVLDTLSDDTREVLTGPFTNYNMLVIDQSLVNNSYISLVNTNVRRNAKKDENYYTANVTATDFRLQDKSRQYSIGGKAALSQKYYDDADTELGHKLNLRVGKTGGAFRVEYGLDLTNDTFDPNDMGYLRRNNEFQNELSVSYNTYNPFWKILTTRSSVQYQYNMLYNPRVFTGSGIEFSTYTTFKNYWTFMLRGEYKPKGSDDYYEPRIDGWYFHRNRSLNFMSWISTNRNKRLSANFRASYTKYWTDINMREYTLSFDPSYKFSNRFSMGYGINLRKKYNDLGFASSDYETEVVIGQRENTTIENKIQTSFIFTANSYLSLNLRHYWSRADYLDKYYQLQMNDGGLVADPSYTENHDYNYNAFNIDMVYTWRFAPGSEMSVVWKNSIYTGSDEIYYDFMDNLNYMFGSDKKNSLSLKILYYLDYQSLRKRK
ncbi:MAG: DUF5916 domain-containing protein, partial [Bacteroidales bacterium]|nr:DUF5916 domain-containing protein [Bacteroidales bacterium]